VSHVMSVTSVMSIQRIRINVKQISLFIFILYFYVAFAQLTSCKWSEIECKNNSTFNVNECFEFIEHGLPHGSLDFFYPQYVCQCPPGWNGIECDSPLNISYCPYINNTFDNKNIKHYDCLIKYDPNTTPLLSEQIQEARINLTVDSQNGNIELVLLGRVWDYHAIQSWGYIAPILTCEAGGCVGDPIDSMDAMFNCSQLSCHACTDSETCLRALLSLQPYFVPPVTVSFTNSSYLSSDMSFSFLFDFFTPSVVSLMATCQPTCSPTPNFPSSYVRIHIS